MSKRTITAIFLVLIQAAFLVSCAERSSYAGEGGLADRLREKDLTVVVTDSGLGGLSITAGIVRSLLDWKAYRTVRMIFVSARFSNRIGYNSLNSREEKIEILDSALRGIRDRFDPDIVLIGCNTLSALADETAFVREGTTPVRGIVDMGVDIISRALKSDPESKVIIFGTQTTIAEDSHRIGLLERGFLPERIASQACPDLVNFIEAGTDSDETEMLIFAYADSVLQRFRNSTSPLWISLNCTHYGYSLDLWRRAFDGLGVVPAGILNPNEVMSAFFENPELRDRFPETDVRVRVVSMVEIPDVTLRTIGRWLESRFPRTAEALRFYELTPGLFEWKHFIRTDIREISEAD